MLPNNIEFMKVMVSRSGLTRGKEIDEFDTPWIAARISKEGRLDEHTAGGIFEQSVWRTVRRKSSQGRSVPRIDRFWNGGWGRLELGSRGVPINGGLQGFQ